MSGRSDRRHHIERLKKKRRKYWSWGENKSDRAIGMLVHTPKTCSCHMCGNPRKYWKEKTIQEKKAEQEYK
jgi:hypothetical protein